MGATTPANPFYNKTYLGTSGLGPNMLLGMVRKVNATGSTKTSTSAAPPSVGQIGGAVMLCYNDSGGTLVRGQVVSRKVDETKAHIRACPANSNAALVSGVVVAPDGIANGYYGWVAVDGLWYVRAGTGGFTKDNGLIVSADAGEATDAAAATGATFAVARETTAENSVGLCEILPRPGVMSV